MAEIVEREGSASPAAAPQPEPEPAAQPPQAAPPPAAPAAAPAPTTAGTPPGPGAGGPPATRGGVLGPGVRRAGSALLVVVAVGAALYGGNVFGLRDRIQPTPKLPTPRAHGAPASNGQAVLASYPWWQGVSTLSGSGSQDESVTIAGGALQWRAQWQCSSGGTLEVRATAGSSSSKLVSGTCPGSGSAITSSNGTVTLAVTASGPWQLQIDQQVDVPLVQTPNPEMTAAGTTTVASGTFYNMDQQGSGKVTIYRVADGSYELRLDNFYVSPNTGLQVQLSSLPMPQSDGDVTGSQIAAVADLVQTTGSLNFKVPAAVDPTKYHSVVIWCVNLRTAYAGAHLVTGG